MYPEKFSPDHITSIENGRGLRRRQQGLGLPATLFVLIIIALLAVAITELERSSAQGVSVSMQSVRAFYAAESGAQAGLTRLFNFDPAAPANAVKPAVCIAGFTINFAADGLQHCSAAVTCDRQSADRDADGNAENFFTLRSTGSCGVGDDTAVRSVEVRAR